MLCSTCMLHNFWIFAMYKRYKILLIVASFLMFISGCGKRRSVLPSTQEQQSILRPFEACVEGVECALCAQEVVNMFNEVEGVHSASYVRREQEYEGGCVHFYYESPHINEAIGVKYQSIDSHLVLNTITYKSLNTKTYLFHDGYQMIALSNKLGASLKALKKIH